VIRTAEEMRRAIRDREQKLGLIPGEFEAVWGQESTGSLDPTLQGRTPTKWGRAQGPFQVMASLHPGFDPSGDLESQLDFAIKLYASGGPDPSSRRQSYYGKGKAPPGQPTTAEYDQQVAARMGEPLQVAQAGVADVPQGLLSQRPTTPMTTMGEQDMPKSNDSQDFLGGLLSDPAFLLGASILGSKNIGRGILGGATAYNQMQEAQALREQKALQAQMLQAKMAEEQRKQQAQAAFMQLLGGFGKGGDQDGKATGPSPAELARIGMYGAVAEIPGASSVMQYGLQGRQYQEMTAAERSAEQQRKWQRQKDEAEMRHRGIGLSPQGTNVEPVAPGLTPEAQQDIAKKQAESKAISTADQKKFAGWADRMSAAEPELKKLETKFAGGGGVPYKDYYAGQNTMTNTFASPEYQAYLTRSRDWVGALLRYESGAAVPEPEFWRYYQTYFAQPGDDPSVVEIKRNLRRRAAASLGKAAGAAMNPGAEPPVPAGFVED
jgi:hypothetical protein